jgi:DNA invertase Pin-like site-specific DNA recombinase
VFAAAEHERHKIGERARHALVAAKARGITLGNPKQAEINRAKAAEQAQALRPHIAHCIRAGRTSSSAIATDLKARHRGTEWRPMVSIAPAIVSAYDRAGGCSTVGRGALRS